MLGLVTSEFLYRANPNEHEGQLTKTKSLLVSKAILSRRALAMGLGRFVLMSHSEVESGGRQRLSILADAFESVLGAIYLDQGFEAARQFIIRWLLAESREIAADKRHTNYKSHLQEYVQSTFRTHPLYRIRSEMGPDHSKMFNVEVLVGRKTLGTGRGRNKKEAEQAAARDALEKVENRNQEQTAREATSEGGALPPTPVARPSAARGAATAERERRGAREESEAEPEERPRRGREPAAREPMAPRIAPAAMLEHEPEIEEGEESESEARAGRRRGRRGGRGRRRPEGVGAEAVPREIAARPAAPVPPAETVPSPEAARGRSLARPRAGHESVVIGSAPLIEPSPAARRGRPARIDDDLEEIGRPEGPLDDGSEEISAPWKPLASRPAAEPVRERQEREREPRREEREPRREEARVVEREEPVIEEEPWSPPSEARREPPAEPAGHPEEGTEGSRFGRRPGRSRRGR